MARVFRLGDTDPGVGQAALSGGAGGVSPISPLTSVIQTSSSRPGQGPRFREAENIQGLLARQDPPGPGIRLGGGGGRGGSAGSPIAGSIQEIGNKFARAIRGLPTVASARQAAIDFGGFELTQNVHKLLTNKKGFTQRYVNDAFKEMDYHSNKKIMVRGPRD
jgi:hypothetical protein